MRSASTFVFLSCLILVAAITANAQLIPLSGEVKGSDHAGDPPYNWSATVEVLFNGKSDGDETNPKNYSFIVEKGANVKLWFNSSGYVPKDITIPDVGKTKPKPKVRMVTLVKYETLASIEGGVAQAIDSNARYSHETGRVDEGMYNLKIMKAELKSNTEALRMINDAEINLKNIQQNNLHRPITMEQEKRWKSFDEIILINNDPKINVINNDQNLINIMKDPLMPRSIRLDAAKALSSPAAMESSTLKNEVLSYFRKEALNSESDLFFSAIYGLTRLGNELDRISVRNGLTNSDPVRVLVSKQALIEVFKNENSPPVRLFAITSLNTIRLQVDDAKAIKAVSARDMSVDIKKAVTNIRVIN